MLLVHFRGSGHYKPLSVLRQVDTPQAGAVSAERAEVSAAPGAEMSYT